MGFVISKSHIYSTFFEPLAGGFDTINVQGLGNDTATLPSNPRSCQLIRHPWPGSRRWLSISAKAASVVPRKPWSRRLKTLRRFDMGGGDKFGSLIPANQLPVHLNRIFIHLVTGRVIKVHLTFLLALLTVRPFTQSPPQLRYLYIHSISDHYIVYKLLINLSYNIVCIFLII